MIFFDLLARILSGVEANGEIHGIKINRDSPPIANLLSADDLIVFCKANMNEASTLLECFDKYSLWLGQVINFSKSSIYFRSNVNSTTKSNICNAMGIKECNHQSSYLGLPFCKGESCSKAFLPMVDKLKAKLGAGKPKISRRQAGQF